MTARGWIALCCLAPSAALASAFELEARTEAQTAEIPAYRGADPTTPVFLPQREIVQYLNLNGYELVTGEDLGFELSLRVFADLGMSPQEAAMLDGVRAEGADLLYANVRYRKWLHLVGEGALDVQLGRQMYVDLMDYMSFDGVRVKYMTQWGVGLEAYGGLWVKGSSLFSSAVYQPDGTRQVDDRSLALAPTADPALNGIEPVYGVKLLTDPIHGISGSLGYRKSILEGATDFERLAGEVRYTRGLGLSGSAGAEYDLMLQRISQFRAQVRFDRETFAVSAEVLRVTPILSSESIWYYFANGGRNEVRLRFDYTPIGAFRYYLSGTYALYDTPVNSSPSLGLTQFLSSPALPSGANEGGSVGTAMKLGHLRAAADATYRDGFGGRQIWLDVTGGVFADRERYSLDARASIASISDQGTPCTPTAIAAGSTTCNAGASSLLTGTFYGLQLWGGYKINPATRVSAVIEENVDPFTTSDTRIFFVFDLKASL